MGPVRRALGDLAEGMRSLLGLDEEEPALVAELLGERRRRTPPRRPRGPSRAGSRVRAPARHLVRVK